MNKRKYIFPLAVAAFGLWACGEDNDSTTACVTEQCLIDQYGEFNADSANDFVEDHRSECQIGAIPTSVNNAKLPAPFKSLDGKRISTKAGGFLFFAFLPA